MTNQPNWSAFVKAAEIAGPPRPSLAWAKAKRRTMHVYPDRVEIGDWVLPHTAVTHAHLYQTQRGIKNRVLEIATPDLTVQINFNPGTSPEGHLPYAIEPKPFPKTMALLRVAIWSVFAIVMVGLFFG